MRRKKTKGVLKSGKIYSAQAYLELVLGECYILDCLKPLLPQIERALYLNRRPYGSFKLQETEKALSHKGNYVLVSCCDVSKDLVPYEEYRWFRVPDNFNEWVVFIWKNKMLPMLHTIKKQHRRQKMNLSMAVIISLHTVYFPKRRTVILNI